MWTLPLPLPPCNSLHLLSDYEFICLHFVVGLDRNSGLHRLRHYCPSPGCRASICDTNTDFVRDYGLSKRWNI